MNYTINPTPIQDAITSKIKTLITQTSFSNYQISEVIEDGIPEDDNVARFSNGKIRPFIIVRYKQLTKKPRSGTFGSEKLATYRGTVDVMIVASTPTVCRHVANLLDDSLVGWSPKATPLNSDGAGSERLTKGQAAWGDVAPITHDGQSVPERWVATTSYRYVPFARKVT